MIPNDIESRSRGDRGVFQRLNHWAYLADQLSDSIAPFGSTDRGEIQRLGVGIMLENRTDVDIGVS
jgi:hypothetical protein